MWNKVGPRMYEIALRMDMTPDKLPWVDGRLDIYKLLSLWKEYHG